MEPNHGQLLYQGKAKRIYQSDNPYHVLVEFKNDATAFNALKKSELEGKGRINCLISACIFEVLESQGLATHYLGMISETSIGAQRVQVIPLEVVIRNVATGSLCRETPIKEGTELFPPLLDLYYKDDSLGDPLLTESRLDVLGLASPSQRKSIEQLARGVNEVLKPFFAKIDLLLVDFKLEIGLNKAGELLVADEISPDTCRIWDMRSKDSSDRILDKDRFRKDLGGVVEAYGEIYKRVQGITAKPRNYL